MPATARPSSCLTSLDTDSTSLTLFGTELQMVSFTVDVGNEMQHIVTSKGEQVAITNRAATGEVVVLKPAVADFDYHAKEIDPCFTGEMRLVAAGLEIAASAVSMGIVSDLGDHNGAATITVPLVFKRDAGNDDLLLKFS